MINLIWDLDGTLFDSYGAIVSGIQVVLKKLNLEYEDSYIHEYIINQYVDAFFDYISEKEGIPHEKIYDIYDNLNHADSTIGLLPHAVELFDSLPDVRHFVVTNRGVSSFDILRQNGIVDRFEEIVEASKGFPRKPAPDSTLYLIRKYNLDPAKTYYVGDRQLDIDAATNAGIPSIYYRSTDVGEVATGATYMVKDLIEILDLNL